jgi:hypothetical protein
VSGIDLTEAIAAAAKARHRWANGQTGETTKWSMLQPAVRMWALDAEQAALKAAAPIIERQVREQIAVEIEAARDWRANNFVGAHSAAISDTYSESACIARGGAS